jgi:hypothetical protein
MAAMENVPHPLHAYLTSLQKKVRAAQLKLAGKLDRPSNNFAAGNVWAGPTARTWGQQLSAKRSTYNSELNKIYDELNAKLATTPTHCTVLEAEDWKRRLADA